MGGFGRTQTHPGAPEVPVLLYVSLATPQTPPPPKLDSRRTGPPHFPSLQVINVDLGLSLFLRAGGPAHEADFL